MRAAWGALVGAMAAVAVSAAPAQAGGGADAGTLSFTLENDLFYDVDRHYTNGLRLTWVPAADVAAPRWARRLAAALPRFGEGAYVRHGYALGQSMFTPSDIEIVDPPLRERPYAGWLYGGIGLGVETGRQLDQLGITLGIVGPSSLAEQSQKLVHKVVDADRPRGWDTQLHDEPGVVLSYQRAWRQQMMTTLIGNQLDLAPHLGLALGNVFTYASGGFTLRYGDSLPRDYGPPRIQPGLPGSGAFSPPADFGWYGFAGLEVRAVARNIFLDGNTFEDSRSVDKRPLVGDLQFGAVLDWPRLRLSYTHVLRSREFDAQRGGDDFGAIAASLKF